jgi:succinyl-CoA synthetase beta subunit
MNIHEYQAKALLEIRRRRARAESVCRPTRPRKRSRRREGTRRVRSWVVKAQIHAGGRGKGGGVKVAKSIDDAVEAAKSHVSA